MREGSKFFQFHAVFGIFLQNRGFAPPSRENPGFATDNVDLQLQLAGKVNERWKEKVCLSVQDFTILGERASLLGEKNSGPKFHSWDGVWGLGGIVGASSLDAPMRITK